MSHAHAQAHLGHGHRPVPEDADRWGGGACVVLMVLTRRRQSATLACALCPQREIRVGVHARQVCRCFASIPIEVTDILDVSRRYIPTLTLKALFAFGHATQADVRKHIVAIQTKSFVCRRAFQRQAPR
jgi:hypothetical protein